MGPNFKSGKNIDLFEKQVQRLVLMMGRKVEGITDVPCGNVCALSGIDSYLLKTGTISNHPAACTIKSMKFSVSPVVRVAVSPKNPVEMPKLVEGLKKLTQYDNIVQVIKNDTGEYVIAGSGELHLEICITNLIEEFAKIEIIKSEPIVPYKETITTISSQVCLSKSPNKLNKLYFRAEPLSEEIVTDIEKGMLTLNNESTYKKLVDTYKWDSHDAKKLWCFGPETSGPNLLVDQTVGQQYLTEVRDSIESALQWATKEGVLAEENVRGIRFNIMDATLHTDKAHRGPNQIVPCARKCYYASQLLASPRFMEPVYLVDISTPVDQINSIYQCFNQRRGLIFNEESIGGTPLINLKAYLPVSESFGFTNHLRSATSGQAFPQMVFDHWEIINYDPLDSKSKAYEIMDKIRRRKGMKCEIPIVSDYLDKL
jgi:elongation factor 2